MKKFLLMTMSCLLILSLNVPALANGWGLKGGIYDIVSDDKRYEGYFAVADDGNKALAGRHVNHAVLQNRYHAVLIAAYREDKVWQAQNVSTTAVFQPGSVPEGLPAVPTITHGESSAFILSYGDREVYTFRYDEDAEYYLARAEFKQNEWYTNALMEQPEGMLFWQSGPGEIFVPVGDALWETSSISLQEFNIAQTPRSMAEVRNMNAVHWALGGDARPLTALSTRKGTENARTFPVYSAPDKTSFRSASGKASVSLGGDVTVYGTEDGWTLISYEVSPRTSRFGYIEGDYADGKALEFQPVALVAAADTFLTDDPFVSQYAQVRISRGAELTGLAQCGEYYAYCEFTQGEQKLRGFVPMKDLTTKYDHPISGWWEIEQGTAPLMADVRWDVMDALVGKWESSDDEGNGRLILFTGGNYRNHMPGDGARYREVGHYRIYGGENGQYELVIYLEAAAQGQEMERRYPLTLNDDGTISVDGVVYRRDEYSTFGNG